LPGRTRTLAAHASRVCKTLCIAPDDRLVVNSSRIMGTSVTQIDATYGHVVPDSEEYLRGLLDAYDSATMSQRTGRSAGSAKYPAPA
jgi:hypothetical protein